MIIENFILPSQLAGLSMLGAFLCLAHAHNRAHYIQNLLRRGTKTEGKVVELRADPGPLFGNRTSDGVAPVVEYKTQSGNVLKHYSTTYRSDSQYKVGMLVPIWFINYRSIREAALEDDTPGTLPRTLRTVGLTLLIISAPNLILGLLKFI